MLDPKSVPPIIETDDIPRKKLEKPYKAPTAEMIAYLDFNVSTTGVLSGVKVYILDYTLYTRRKCILMTYKVCKVQMLVIYYIMLNL